MKSINPTMLFVKAAAFVLAFFLVFPSFEVFSAGAKEEQNSSASRQETQVQEAEKAAEQQEKDGDQPEKIDRSVLETALPEGFDLLTENKGFRLFMEPKEFNLALEDKCSGRIFYTSPPARKSIEGMTGAGGLAAGSHLIVSYFDSSIQSSGSVNSLLGAVRQKTVQATPIKDGVRLDFDFSRKKEGFKIPLEIRLTERGLSARVLFDEIEEYTNVLITDLAVLPYFGTGTTEDEGFLLIPDGSGAVIRFNTGRRGMNVFSREVYGRDAALTTVKKSGAFEELMLPMFGVKKNDMGFVAYATKGAGSSALTASPAGISGPLNYAYFSFTYRKTDNIVLADATWTPRDVVFVARSISQSPYVEVCYDVLGKEEADLGGMAKAYRAHLEREGLKSPASPEIAVYADVYGAVKKERHFIGIPYIGVEKITTFDQMQEMADTLSKGTDARLILRCHGVQKGGMDDTVPTAFSPERRLGGKKAFRSLCEAGEKNRYTVIPELEFLRISKSKIGWSFSRVGARNISKSMLEEYQYQISTFFRSDYRCNLLGARMLNPAMDSFLKSAEKQQLSALSAGSLGHLLYTDFDSNKLADEDAMITCVRQALEKAQKQCGTVMISGGADYALPFADHVTDVAISDSGYDVSTARVPFYQMVVNGYVQLASRPLNGSANFTDSFLLCMETGTAPNFVFTHEKTEKLENTNYEHLTSTEFSVWKDEAVKAYDAFYAVYSDVADRRIADYEILQDKLRKTTFADQTVIYVNYGFEDAEADGLTVPAKGYAVQKKG